MHSLKSLLPPRFALMTSLTKRCFYRQGGFAPVILRSTEIQVRPIRWMPRLSDGIKLFLYL
jgi:hypothetical protein